MSETSHEIHTDDIIVDADEKFTIDTVTRAISNGSNKKLIIMQHDHKSERYSFEIDREIDGHDLTKCNDVRIHFNNIGSNRQNYASTYKVDDVHVDPDNNEKVIFTWLVGGESTQFSGVLSFLVSFKCLDEEANILYSWNSSICNSIQIASGMDNDELIFDLYSDVLLKWQNEMEVEYIPNLVNECYVDREFATSEEVGSILSITDPDGTAPLVIVSYETVDDASIDDLFNN